MYLNACAFTNIKQLELSDSIITRIAQGCIESEIVPADCKLTRLTFEGVYPERANGEEYFVAEFKVSWSNGQETYEPVRITADGVPH